MSKVRISAVRPTIAKSSVFAPVSSGSAKKFGFGALLAGGVAMGLYSLLSKQEEVATSNFVLPVFEDIKQNVSQPAFSLIPVADAADIPVYGVPGTNKERSFIAIKPDGVQRGLVGEIIARFEKKGYKLVGIKVIQPSKQFAEKHYADLKTKPFFPSLVEYFSSGPVVAMVWEGKDVITNGRKLVGATNPAAAEMGSIRGDLAIQIGRNIIHGSDSPDSAQAEISLWFAASEVTGWGRDVDKWIYEKPENQMKTRVLKHFSLA